jgi:hypothetical protein
MWVAKVQKARQAILPPESHFFVDDRGLDCGSRHAPVFFAATLRVTGSAKAGGRRGRVGTGLGSQRDTFGPRRETRYIKPN